MSCFVTKYLKIMSCFVTKSLSICYVLIQILVYLSLDILQKKLYITTSVRSKLNFWVPKKSNSQAELDYVLPWKDILVPIEVKSGASGTLRSLHRFIDEAPHDIAVRIYAGRYNVENTSTISGKRFLDKFTFLSHRTD